MAPRPMELAEQAIADALALRPGTEEDEAAWLSADEAEGGAVVHVTEREDIPLALDQHEMRMPWDRRCVPCRVCLCESHSLRNQSINPHQHAHDTT